MNEQINNSSQGHDTLNQTPQKVINLPNFLTILRILAIPIFITTIIYHKYLTALSVFICAAITDALDGLIARLTKQQTDLGRFLDPLADKILLTTSFILFAYYGWIPIWLTIIVITRDTIVVVGWFILYLVKDTTQINPSILGKTAIAMQLIFIAYKILQINYAGFPNYSILMVLTAFFTVISGLQYIYKGFAYSNG